MRFGVNVLKDFNLLLPAAILFAIVIGVAISIAIVILVVNLQKRDENRFDHSKLPKNNTGYDGPGNGYHGLNQQGYNREGYNVYGKNEKGQYNRFYDLDAFRESDYSTDGFLNPRIYPVAVTNHARERMNERLGIDNNQKMDELAVQAYQFGKSARQVKKSAAAQMHEIEQRHENGVVLLYRNYLYIFSHENVLITVYRNQYISL